MKVKNIIFTAVIVLVIIVFVLFKFLLSNNSSNFDNLTIYKNNDVINITKEEKDIIIKYLKQEKFKQIHNENGMKVQNDYVINYDNIEISFGDDIYCIYKNNYTEENYYTSISEELKKYIMDITM